MQRYENQGLLDQKNILREVFLYLVIKQYQCGEFLLYAFFYLA